MKTTIYRNYNTMGWKVAYHTAAAEISDKLTVIIPEDLNPYKTVSGQIAIKPENTEPYMLNEALNIEHREDPTIVYIDNDKRKHIRVLKIIEG